MYPILIEIGNFKIYTYGVFIAIAFILSAEYVARISHEIGIKSHEILDVILWVLAGGVIGTRIAYIIMNIGDYVKDPIKIFKIWEGGLAWYGGVILSIILVYVWTKRAKKSFWRVGDLVSLAVILGLSIGRWGCFSAGCCYGKPTEFPTGVIFKSPLSLSITGVPIHPTQIYEALGMFFTFAFARGIMVGWRLKEGGKRKIQWRTLLEIKTDIFLVIQILLVRLYYMWYGKGIPFPAPIDFIFLPAFIGMFYLSKFVGIRFGQNTSYSEGFFFALHLAAYGMLRFFLEFVRDPSGLSGFIFDKLITLNHLISITMAVVGIYILLKKSKGTEKAK